MSACMTCARTDGELICICAAHDKAFVCKGCLPRLPVPRHRLDHEMRCLKHFETMCAPAMPAHVYYAILRACMPLEQAKDVMLDMVLHAHRTAAHDSPEVQLISCPSCGSMASVPSGRLRPWSSFRCGICLDVFCCRCAHVVDTLPPRMEVLPNKVGVPWWTSDCIKPKGCPCPPLAYQVLAQQVCLPSRFPAATVLFTDARAQVWRSLSLLKGRKSTDVDARLRVPSAAYADIPDVVSAVLQYVSRHKVCDIAFFADGIPEDCAAGMDVLNWMQDAVGDGQEEGALDFAAWVFLSTVPSATAVYCMTSCAFWVPALRRLLPSEAGGTVPPLTQSA